LDVWILGRSAAAEGSRSTRAGKVSLGTLQRPSRSPPSSRPFASCIGKRPPFARLAKGPFSSSIVVHRAGACGIQTRRRAQRRPRRQELYRLSTSLTDIPAAVSSNDTERPDSRPSIAYLSSRKQATVHICPDQVSSNSIYPFRFVSRRPLS
jgi:hypothetical protein